MKEHLKKLKKAIISHSLLIVFAFSSVTVLAVSIYSRTMIIFFIDTSERNIRDKLLEAAKRLAILTSAEELDNYREPADVERPDYKALRQKLVEFAKDTNVLYAYYLRVNGDKVQYIVDNDFDEETRVGIDTEPAELSTYANIKPVLEGKASVTRLGEYAKEWPELCTAFAPIFKSDGSVAALSGVDINDAELFNMHRIERHLTIFELIAVALVFASGGYGLIKFRREANTAKSASTAKNGFLARMSHEIRTPMNAVLGMSDLAIMNYGKPEGIEYIADIKRSGSHLLAVINGILDLSAVESGKLTINKAPYKMASVLGNVFTIIRMRLNDKDDVKLSLDIDPYIPATLIGDEKRVEEIILNLLSNAVKYTRQGFIKFAVRGQRDRRGNIFLTFDVSDSGIGIKPEDVDTLFADFSRIDNKYNIGTQGAGLGLAITRALCRMMGGNVVVKSQYEVGSTFTASFNQGIADASPMGAFKENSAFIDERAGSADFIAPDFRVLIVDDNMTNLQVTERLLASYQMEMDTCLSGLEAVAIVQQKEYDLVLVDTMMPGIDNLETAAEIRGLGVKFKKLPIVALAANAVGRMKTVFLNKGFNDCLSKPIEMSNLKALLEKIVPAEKKVKGKARATTDGRGQTITGTSPRIQAALDSQAANGGMSAKTPPDSTRLDQIDGLDTKKGMANTGGAPSAYQGVLEVYCRDARNRFELLSAESAESDLKNYITNVHALKSASASIGAIGLSEAAAVLEAAGLRGNMEYIRRATADFRNRLIDLTEQIEIAMVVEKDTEPLGAGRETNNGQSNASVAPALAALKEALEKEDIGRTDRLLAELSMMHPSPEAGKLISRVTELVLTSEFQAAAKYMGDAIGGHVTP